MVTGLLKDARFVPAPVSNYSRCADATCRRAECEAEQRRWHAENPRLAREAVRMVQEARHTDDAFQAERAQREARSCTS